MMDAYYKRLTGTNAAERQLAAKAWARWEAATSFLRQNPSYTAKLGQDTVSEAFSRIECHYFVNGGFLATPNQLIETSAASATFPPSSCRVVTISSVRCEAPGICIAPGRRRIFTSCPTPGTPPSSPAIPTSSSRRRTASRHALDKGNRVLEGFRAVPREERKRRDRVCMAAFAYNSIRTRT